jgi:hypothetical protein
VESRSAKRATARPIANRPLNPSLELPRAMNSGHATYFLVKINPTYQ